MSDKSEHPPSLVKDPSGMFVREHDVKEENIEDVAHRLGKPFLVKLFVFLHVVVGIPVVFFLVFFSSAGFAIRTFRALHGLSGIGYGLMFMALIIMLLLNTFDFLDWNTPRLKIFRTLSLATVGGFVVAGMLFLSEDYPYSPICLYMAGLPLYLIGVYQAILAPRFQNVGADARVFLRVLPGPMFIVSTIALAFWVAWIVRDTDNEWSDQTQARYADRLKCEADDLIDDSSECLDAFMIWVSPLVISMATFLYGFIAYFLDDKESHTTPKYFGMCLLFLLFGLWCAASLSGAGAGVSDAFFAFVMAGMIALGFMVVGTFGVNGFTEEAKNSAFYKEMVKKYGGMADWFKGLFVVTCTPLVVFYLFLSFLNQSARRNKCFTCTRKLEDDHYGRGWFTKSAQLMVAYVRTWEWTSVLSKGLIWGIAFMVMNVIVAKFTVLFLSVLISFCEGIMDDSASLAAGLVLVTAVIVGVGLVLFLLPPVPGVPIYLTGGIILVAAGTNNTPDADGGIGVWPSIAYTIVVSLLLKLFACTCQQCLIGMPMRNSVAIKQAVSINSHTIRTMRLILGRPGLNLAKVSILIGGPDWPTSVLCGIMGLNLLPVLVGTLPVVFLIAPTVLAGSFGYLGSLTEGNWGWAITMASIFLAIAGAVQSGSMIMAAYYLEKAVNESAEELAQIPLDEDVLKADAQAKAKSERYVQVRKFADLHWFFKGVLVLAMMFMISTCYVVQIYSSSCFRTFELTDKIKDLPGGHWYNFLTTLGWVCMGMFGASCILYIIFNKYIGYRVHSSIKERPLAVQSDADIQGEDEADAVNATSVDERL